MKRIIAIMMMGVAAAVNAQQTNTLDTYKQARETREQTILAQYGKALDTTMAALKKKGDLDNVLILQAEKERFGAEKTVPVPTDAKDSFRPVSEAYYRAMVSMMGQYVAALEGLVKKEVAADRIEEAKVIRAEKDRAAFVLADLQTKVPADAGSGVSSGAPPPPAEPPSDAAELCEIVVAANVPVSVEKLVPGSARLSGGFTPAFDTVSTDLNGAQYIRVPWQSTPSYKVTVTKPGLLYQTGSPGDLGNNTKFVWEKADSELSGPFLADKNRAKVAKGMTFKCSGYELSFIAKTITLK
jgi:hypothetical protein